MKKTCGLPLLGFLLFFMLCTSSLAMGAEAANPEETPAFSISRIAIAKEVQDSEPIGVAESFPASTEKVYCFIETTDVSKNTEATFVWYHDGEEMHTFTLPLMAGPRWRTYAYKNLYGKTGEWKVEIRDSSGNGVKSISFKVE